MIEIRHWYTNEVIYTDPEATTVAEALARARLDGASLDGARLDGASLVGARLDGARLVGARLDGARLVGASLDGASLVGASLRDAELEPIKQDLFAVLRAAEPEVPGLLKALREGRVDGSTYQGECACLVGTIANVRGCSYEQLGALKPDSSRPAEIWFLAIRKGYKPDNSQVAAITAEWIEEFLAQQPKPAEATPS